MSCVEANNNSILFFNYVSVGSGATVAFVLGFLLMILAALMFFFGASTQKLCNSLIEPSYPLFSEVSKPCNIMHAHKLPYSVYRSTNIIILLWSHPCRTTLKSLLIFHNC